MKPNSTPSVRSGLVLLSFLALTLAASLKNHSTANGGSNDKVKICHCPPGNPDNKHTIEVSRNALRAHRAHGDELMACEDIPREDPPISRPEVK